MRHLPQEQPRREARFAAGFPQRPPGRRQRRQQASRTGSGLHRDPARLTRTRARRRPVLWKATSGHAINTMSISSPAIGASGERPALNQASRVMASTAAAMSMSAGCAWRVCSTRMASRSTATARLASAMNSGWLMLPGPVRWPLSSSRIARPLRPKTPTIPSASAKSPTGQTWSATKMPPLIQSSPQAPAPARAR